MKIDQWTRRACVGTALFTVFGCTTPAPLGPAVRENALIDVEVVVRRDCTINLPANNPKSCNGVGKADGLACGSPGDTIRWKVRNQNGPAIESVAFAVGNDAVCTNSDLSPVNGVVSCVLKAQPDVDERRGLAFKYELKMAGCAAPLDPYVIVTRR